MKISKNLKLSLLASSFLALSFTACGSSSSSSTGTSTQTGTFVDAPVKGLYYKTASQEGYTNEKGEFSYKVGEKVQFKLGDLSLGEVDASSFITPYTLANTTSNNGNDLSTNIALLLQNLDEDRSDDILDVEKLKDFNFAGFDLSSTKEAMETLISNKLTGGEFDEYIQDKSLLDINTVNNAMKTFVQKEESKFSDPRLLIGKRYKLIDGGSILGYSDANFTMTFSENEIKGVDGSGKSFSDSYELEDNLIKVNWGGSDIGYIKILLASDTMVSACEGSDKQEVQSCTNANEYYINPSYAGEFVKTKNTSLKNILDKKTLLTNLDELENKYLYQLNEYEHNSFYNKEAIRISNGKMYTYWTRIDDNDLSDNNIQNTYDVSFSNNKIDITGGDEEGMNYPVYKYNLKDEKISLNEFGHSSLFDDKELRDNTTGKSISFTSGNMYCHVLWWECWLDENAMNQITAQIGEKE